MQISKCCKSEVYPELAEHHHDHVFTGDWICDNCGMTCEVEQRTYFKASTSKADDGFQMCVSGKSTIDNENWVVTTHQLHADEVPEECADAKTFSELVAKLLNEHYNK